ncbi:hypothetical protein [Lactococcus garvieae]|jgi:hypothetical protein|uniref:hypothetical protein n=1 Tax=Lactococcus garvieae TaxID=1363 RepID=UPI0009C0FC0C|nr:hypothetical protein [Lactococcus garvieae]QPS71090.1 hypothetical protein I6G50_10300 [Lactococcus garvieae]
MENLRNALENMEVVTLGAAVKFSGLSREDVLLFIHNNPHLRVFDEENQYWINENVDGHC